MARTKPGAATASPFLSVPTEIRLLIYEHLLDDGGNRWLAIQSRPDDAHRKQCSCRAQTRSRYLVLDQTIHRRCYETTYQLATPAATFHTSIMAVSRLIHLETSRMVYGRHAFDFGDDLAAAVPFLRDRTSQTRQLLRLLALHKQAPVPTRERDKCEWAQLCRYLAEDRPGSELRLKLRLVIEGGRLPPARFLLSDAKADDGHSHEEEQELVVRAQEEQGGGPDAAEEALSVADLEELMRAGDESVEWVRELARTRGVFEELEVVLQDTFCSPRAEGAERVAALTAPVGRNRGAMEDFLKGVLGIEDQ